MKKIKDEYSLRTFIRAFIFSLSCLLQTTAIYATQPVNGWYAGVFLGPTYTPNIDFTFNPSSIPADTRTSFSTTLATFLGVSPTTINALLNSFLPDTNINGQLKYSVLGGVGGEVGYRFCDKMRVELEVFYNNNPFSELVLGNYTIDSVSSNPYFHIGGDTNTGAGLVNAVYDLLIPSNDGYSNIAPYVGVGLGYAYVQNALQFHYGSNVVAVATTGATPATLYEKDFTKAHSTYAGQIFGGASYFMDDFCWLSLDLRYFTTGTSNITNPVTDAKFQHKTQLLTATIGFTGAIDAG